MNATKTPNAIESHRANVIAHELPHYQIPPYLYKLVPGPLSESHLIALNQAKKLEAADKNRPQIIALLERHIKKHLAHLAKQKS